MGGVILFNLSHDDYFNNFMCNAQDELRLGPGRNLFVWPTQTGDTVW